jgi:cytochrome P450
MPIIDRICRLNPISKYFKPKQSAVFALRCKKILADRIAEEKSGKYEVQRQTRPHDFTYAFLEAQRKDPSISDGQLIGYVQANLVAGSDTTAVVMRTALYYTMKQPWIHKRILAELDAQKELTYPVPYKTARFELPFCAAVVRESLRKHFAFIGMMERQVPDGGAEMPDGRRLPGGTVIGMHGDLIGLNKDIFGQDAHEFNPLRWLPGVEESTFDFERRLKAMNSHDLAFGHGPRGCIGKHVAEMEIYKFVPTFFGLIEVSFRTAPALERVARNRLC